jgi:hypothetical protein
MADFLPPLLWKPSPNFSERNARVDLLVLHDCEGSYSASVSWFLMKESQVSAHFVCREDGCEVTQMVELADKGWHACNFNSRSVGWEMAGYEKNGFKPELLLTTARAFAYLAHHLQIPIRHARGGVGPGIESHFGLGRAGGGHSDPSKDPAWMDTFVAQVQAEANKGDFPALWEPPTAPTPCPLTPLSLDTEAGVLAALKSLGFDSVVAFQTARKIEADGIAGPDTKHQIELALQGS